MKIGDLVCVVRPTPCCGTGKWLGLIFTVQSIVENAAGYCNNCGKTNVETAALGESQFFGAFCSLLRVIPPLNELEAEKAVEHA